MTTLFNEVDFIHNVVFHQVHRNYFLDPNFWRGVLVFRSATPCTPVLHCTCTAFPRIRTHTRSSFVRFVHVHLDISQLLLDGVDVVLYGFANNTEHFVDFVFKFVPLFHGRNLH